jgi:hypothetical protein
VREIRIAVGEQQVGGTVVAPQLVRPGEEQRGHEGQREDHVARRRQNAIAPLDEPPRREPEPDVQEHSAPQRAEDQSDRVDQPRVGGLERVDEPREPEHDHQRAGPAQGAQPPRVQAGCDEAPPDRGAEDRPRDLSILVVAREGQRDDAAARHERGDDDRHHERPCRC